MTNRFKETKAISLPTKGKTVVISDEVYEYLCQLMKPKTIGAAGGTLSEYAWQDCKRSLLEQITIKYNESR